MLTVTVFIFLVALIFDFLNGMDNAANSIAAVVSTRLVSPRLAVMWAAVFNFGAAFGSGVHGATTIGKGIVETAVVSSGMILSALIGAITWTHLWIKYGLPISVSHPLIGGVAGPAVARTGIDSLIVERLVKVGIFMVLSPVMGLIIDMLLMIAVTRLV